MNELRFWSGYVKPALNSERFHRVAWKVGTSTRAGIPDVAYCSKGAMAWIEMKYLSDWPVRETTPITLGLTLEQRAHLRDWCRNGRGHGFVLLLIGKDVLLFPWNVPDVIQRDNLTTVTLSRVQLKDTKNLLAREIDALILPDRVDAKEGTWAELP